jgi:glycosyltransferase involved in cell wall biosynthesis
VNVLFVHNNFPAQFRYLARALSRDPSVKMVGIGSNTAQAVPGVELRKYALGPKNLAGTHPFARRFDLECQRAEQVLYALSSLVTAGFTPDVILAHPGWGETLPLRIMFPEARLIIYCEFFYGDKGRDVDFDPEFPNTGLDGNIGLKLKNAATLLALNDADCGVSPTEWQRSTYPSQYQSNISVIHEGVDVDLVKPAPAAVFKSSSGLTLRRSDEVVTFVVRNLEPLRGYHVFMRSLPSILKRRPRAQIVIVGGDDTSYGRHPPAGTSWKSVFLAEVAGKIDPNRVHFVGQLPYAEYLKVLQISSAHVYLTYPFVLSWSFLEALSSECLVIGSDTAPVREIIEDGRNGLLVPFFDTAGLADRVVDALANPSKFKPLRTRARQTVLDTFDMERHCIPKMIDLMQGPGGGAAGSPAVAVKVNASNNARESASDGDRATGEHSMPKRKATKG